PPRLANPTAPTLISWMTSGGIPGRAVIKPRKPAIPATTNAEYLICCRDRVRCFAVVAAKVDISCEASWQRYCVQRFGGPSLLQRQRAALPWRTPEPLRRHDSTWLTDHDYRPAHPGAVVSIALEKHF